MHSQLQPFSTSELELLRQTPSPLFSTIGSRTSDLLRAVASFVFRETILDNFPQLGNTVDNIRSRFGGGGNSYSGLDHLDPEENLDLSPEFLGATAPRHPQGPYNPLGGQ